MAERICETCGTRNDAEARFCVNCDSYLGWDVGRSTLDGDALTGTIPKIVQSVPTAVPEPATAPVSAPVVTPTTPPASPTTPPPASPTATPPTAPAAERAPQPEQEPPRRKPARHDPPTVTVTTPDVVLTPEAPARIELLIENTSTIVDGYDIDAVDPPAWLELTPPDAHLMPGEARTVMLSLAIRPGVLVLAQRRPLAFTVRSLEDAERMATIHVVATVPPRGARLAIEARPMLIRLEDAATGSFSLRLDNRGANFPQTVGLSGDDPESVVRFTFTPQVVEVPAGAIVEASVDFVAPPPQPGAVLNRQLTISATNDEGPVTATVTLVQETAPEPVDAPLRVQLQPSTLRLLDAQDADFDVNVDNRGGHTPVTVTLTGADPERRLAFAFAPVRFVAVAGHITRAHGRVRANLPARGASASHPFTVVASDGTTDAEAAGVLEITSSAAAITTASLSVNPQRQDIGTHGKGTFGVDIDNRRGAEAVQVAFAARSDDGQARATFAPPQLVVPPGTTGHTWMTVTAPHPPRNGTVVRRLEVTASDGTQQLAGNAELTQTAPSRRGPVSVWLVILGAVLVVIGTLSPWFAQFDPLLPAVELVRMLVQSSSLDPGLIVEPALRLLLFILAITMAFGLNGKSGGLTRKSAILIVLLSAGFLVFLAIAAFVPELAFGILLVWLGAVLGYVGGVLARSRD
ncbi:hypothetical protein J2X63_002149 [Agromyces sp. 3263]|uniref:COG1470 family protein n=1 Tax=Agromyces sp. 3263 TaxID=2817750 RepID=UPI0028571AE0|nr:hypothetical protein [Agromyces sp. 3263]MDR6906463.1 hypothetical protein [Agromyces sp. 3263]